jgi:hypothetical protein
MAYTCSYDNQDPISISCSHIYANTYCLAGAKQGPLVSRSSPTSFSDKALAEYGNDIDIFAAVDVPEGVEILAWGMKHIAEPLRGKIVEIGMDATCKPNLFH